MTHETTTSEIMRNCDSHHDNCKMKTQLSLV